MFRITDDSVDLAALVRHVSDPEAGAIATFLGTTRATNRGRAVLRLEYEAYPPMAERVLASIGAEVAERFGGTRLAIMHRVGTLMPGELAVVIAAAAPHRKEAFLACEHAIERLKQDVPIWKKEFFEDGEVWVGLGP